MMSVGWKSTGDIKRSLVYKLIDLENARNAMNEKLYHFTEKVGEIKLGKPWIVFFLLGGGR